MCIRDRCRQLARELGLAEKVLFPGYIDRMEDWYPICDIAVSSSRSEGLPFNLCLLYTSPHLTFLVTKYFDGFQFDKARHFAVEQSRTAARSFDFKDRPADLIEYGFI